MGNLRFTKMHGCGNDYIYINCFEEQVEDPAALAVRLSDRHKGIGGDGVILICPSEVADAKMRMFNLDGSEGKMCGNGIRCVAKYVFDHRIAHKLFDMIDESYDAIVLDEILDVITLSLINEGKVYDLLVKMKDSHEIILTGRMPSHKIKPILDYSSEIKKHKHPFDLGIKARHGIEY